MKRIQLIIFLLFSCFWLPAQNNLVNYEYWFNGDYSSRQSLTVTPSTINSLNASIDASFLQDGVNVFNIRYRDENGIFSSTLSELFYKSTLIFNFDHKLVSLEYWFNNEYNSRQVLPIANSDEYLLTTSIDATSLHDGVNVINIRYKDDSGIYSSILSEVFYKSSELIATDNKIVLYEYWFNDDYSSRQTISVSPTDEYLLTTSIDATSLNDGVNVFNIRYKDASGIYGSTLSEFIYKIPQNVSATNLITSFRYWLDDDFNNSVDSTLTTGITVLDLTDDLDMTKVSAGNHIIHFQFKDANGHWSVVSTDSITKTAIPVAGFSVPATLCTGSPVDFSNESVDADTWFWDFGDGSSSAAFEPSHYYVSPGDYSVTLIVTDSNTDRKDTISQTITVNESYGISIVAPENLVAYYPLNGNADDESGLNHNGTVFEAIPTTDRNGNDNQAYYFDGVNDYIDLGDWENGGPMSFTFWARWDAFNNYSRIVDLGNGPSSNNIIVANYQNGNNIFFSIYNNSSEIKYYTSAINLGEWDYYAMTIDDQGLMNVYKNGILIGNKTGANVPNILTRTAQYIGKSNFSQDGYFNGAIDELKIYDKALSAEEILIDYQGIGGTPLPPVVAEICASEAPYALGTQQLYTSGTYYETFTTETGCDSIVQLNLTVHPVYNDTVGEPLNYQINDDFEDDVLGNLPDGWVIRYNGTGTSDQKVVASPVKNGAHSIQVSGSSWAANLSKAVASFPDKVTLEAWVRIENVLTGGACGLSIGNPSIATWGSFLGRVETEGGNFITYNHSGSATTKYILQPAEASSWTLIKIEYDFSSFTYKVFINGEQTSGISGANVLTEFPLLETVPPTSVELYGNSMVYFDDVKLYESGNTAITICSSDIPYVFGTQQLKQSGTYTETFKSSSGCDSIVTMTLNVIPVTRDTLFDAVCENALPYIWRGKEFLTTGIYSDSLMSVSGCDSIKFLSLEVLPVYNDTLYDATCENSLPYIWRGKEYTATGIYSDSLTAVSGCDSIKFLSLEVFPVYSDTLYDATCENSLPYIWRGKEFTAAGIYSDSLTSFLGCDSIKFLSLEVLSVYRDTLYDATCENSLPYIWRGKEFTGTGTYSDSLISVNGCDSLKTLSLIVNPNYEIAISDSVYRHKLPYQFGNQMLSVTGEYVDSLQTIDGCDSIVKLTFKVLIDTVPPDVICNAISVTLNSAGNYLLSKNEINKLAEGTSDNANEYDELTVSVIPNTFTCSDVGENVPVKVIVNDFEENADTCYTTVLVLDKNAPMITCTNLNITLDKDGLANIDSDKLYSSVSDACGIHSVAISKNQFSCDDIGQNRIEVTAVDNNGNSSTCYANVNVQAFITNPAVDSIKDIQIMEDSVLDSFLISGIYDGTACADDSLDFIISYSNSALIESYAVDYVTGEDTALFKLFPVQNMSGYSDVTILITNTVSGQEFSREFGFTVLPVNDAPYSVSGLDDQELTAGDSLILKFSSEKGVFFNDVDEEDQLYLSLEQLSGEVLPDWIIFRNDSLFAYPSKADTGCFELNIIATDTEGLEATSTFNLCVDHLVGINYFAEKNLKVYPNPTTGIVYIDFIAGGNNDFDISVWNVLGESVFQKSFTGGSLAEIDLSKHVSGFYYLRVSRGQSEKIFKLILTHE